MRRRLRWAWRNFRPRYQVWLVGEQSGVALPMRFVRFRREADGRAWVQRANTERAFPGMRVELLPLGRPPRRRRRWLAFSAAVVCFLLALAYMLHLVPRLVLVIGASAYAVLCVVQFIAAERLVRRVVRGEDPR